MDKPGRIFARPLSDAVHKTLKAAFAKQGFAAAELVTRWPEIVGADIAANCAPEKIQWPRPYDGEEQAPGTLHLRVEGPTALEIQQLSGAILARVNQFFGWQAVTQVRLRQAPFRRHEKPAPPVPDTEAAERIASTLTEISDDKLRAALGRLGAAARKS